MRKNRLYTVNKYNKPMFQGDRLYQNIFDGEDTSFLQTAKTAYTGGDYGVGGYSSTNTGTSGGNSFSSSFKSAIGNTFSTSGIGSALGSSLTGGLASAVGGTIGGLISNGYSSTAGSVVDKVGDLVGMIPGFGTIAGAGLKVLSGGINALFGSKVDQAKL